MPQSENAPLCQVKKSSQRGVLMAMVSEGGDLSVM